MFFLHLSPLFLSAFLSVSLALPLSLPLFFSMFLAPVISQSLFRFLLFQFLCVRKIPIGEGIRKSGRELTSEVWLDPDGTGWNRREPDGTGSGRDEVQTRVDEIWKDNGEPKVG